MFSISGIRLFKACRRAYEFKYVFGLVPLQKAEALETGIRYHSYLEDLYGRGEFDMQGERTKEAAMTLAHIEHVYPYVKEALGDVEVEKWFERGNLRGRLDGWATDKGVILEHKTTSMDAREYEGLLELDDQLLAYMWLTGARQTVYTVIRKPTIRQGKSETEDEFFARCWAWYREDTISKIRAFPVFRSDADVEEFGRELEAISDEIEGCSNYYRNTCHCRAWGRPCEYATICGWYKDGDALPPGFEMSN